MTGNLNNDIDIFMHMVEKVDNAAGRLIGDISLKEDDYSIEYAIKATNASLQSYNQIRQLANIVLGKSKKVKGQTLSKESIRTRLKQLREIDDKAKAFRNHIYDLVEEDVVKYVGKKVDAEILAISNIQFDTK